MHRRAWPTRQELSSEVFEYVEGLYNRRHSTRGMLSPADYEQQHAAGSRAPAKSVNGVLTTLRVANTNDDYYNHNN